MKHPCAAQVFDLVDANGDGVISFEEFREMMGLSPNEADTTSTLPSSATRPRTQSAATRIKSHAAHERRMSQSLDLSAVADAIPEEPRSRAGSSTTVDPPN